MGSSSYSGFFPAPAKCRLLVVNEKRELVCELSKRPDSAAKLLHEWTRRDITEILCSELGVEKKHTGLSKHRILLNLFQAVNGKSSCPVKYVKKSDPEPHSSNLQVLSKRQRTNEAPSLPVIASTPVTAGVSARTKNARLCQNKACRANLNLRDKFCRRCSCCICFTYDKDKDPSFWLFCNSDQSLQEDSCDLSCHLECALEDKRTGILQSRQSKKLDGYYYCIHCGKQNDLLGCWKKQLLAAKTARRLDELSFRIFLSHKILRSTEKYLVLHEIVDTAMKKLEGEVGPITGEFMGWGIVNRLAVGAEVQKLCAFAVETLESMFPDALTSDLQIQRYCMVPSNFINLEDISPKSVTVVFDLDLCPTFSQGLTGFNLWHRKADVEDYPSNPTGIILMPSTMLVISGLAPCTYYVIKVVAFTNSKEIGSWEVRTKTIFPKKKRTKTIFLHMEDDTKKLAPVDSSGLSNPSSEGVELNNDSTIYVDINMSSESAVEYCENPDILCNEPTSNSQDTKMGYVGATKVDELEEALGVSSALDKEEEEHGSAAQAALLRKSSHLYNLAMIAAHAHNVNKSVGPPEYSCSLLPIIPGGTENCMGVTGTSFEGKSGDNIPQDDSFNAETDPGNWSWKRTSGRSEDCGHNDGPSETNTAAQMSSLSGSSNLVLHKQGILLQNLNKDAARLESAAGLPQYSGSLVPMIENGIKFGNGVSETSFKSKDDDHAPQTDPWKPETEPGKFSRGRTEPESSSNKKPSGKFEDIVPKDARSGACFEYCVKVIRWLECEGYIEANFRVKFLTWFSLRATPHERMIVRVYADTLIDDPVSLSGQLSDTFSDAIYRKRP